MQILIFKTPYSVLKYLHWKWLCFSFYFVFIFIKYHWRREILYLLLILIFDWNLKTKSNNRENNKRSLFVSLMMCFVYESYLEEKKSQNHNRHLAGSVCYSTSVRVNFAHIRKAPKYVQVFSGDSSINNIFTSDRVILAVTREFSYTEDLMLSN